jgi:hypothetical protein
LALPLLDEGRVTTILDDVDWLRVGCPAEWEERNASSVTFRFKWAATPWHGCHHNWYSQLLATAFNIIIAQSFPISQLANAFSCFSLLHLMRHLALHTF